MGLDQYETEEGVVAENFEMEKRERGREKRESGNEEIGRAHV